ncbi:Uncharacterised protein [Mycobacterium tuberculosis]|nr:Uncharacterised protein [Mycobacterium tuberculosis]
MTPSFPRTGVSGHAGAVQRGDGNLHPESPYARNASNVSSDPKPREGTETRNPAPHPQLRHAPEVVRPKTPRGDGNADGTELSGFYQVVVRPKTPRGDGNPTMASKSAWVTDPGRQTQNPERGRKPSWWDMDERDYRGRRTQNPERGRKLNNTFFERGAVESVVRPKTPRGDGNARNRPTWACPQRVVRPKTPRGDGNTETQHQPDNLILASSDPKPREGTETPRGWRMRCARKCRQTQNPERGRKHTADDSYVRVTSSQSSDPKPREGTET